MSVDLISRKTRNMELWSIEGLLNKAGSGNDENKGTNRIQAI
jgi:hypothetical protein